MSISLRSGARGFQRLIYLKYYSILNLESRFTLGLNAAKNTGYMKKSLEQEVRQKGDVTDRKEALHPSTLTSTVQPLRSHLTPKMSRLLPF